MMFKRFDLDFVGWGICLQGLLHGKPDTTTRHDPDTIANPRGILGLCPSSTWQGRDLGVKERYRNQGSTYEECLSWMDLPNEVYMICKETLNRCIWWIWKTKLHLLPVGLRMDTPSRVCHIVYLFTCHRAPC